MIYKLQSQNNKSRGNQSNSRSGESLQSRYFKIKVKQQSYLGKPALSIFLSDYTDKIHDKLNNLVYRESYDKE